jgi:exodeoxyribonuclease VII small subunit
MPRAKKAAETWDYEASVEQVEAIITNLETGDLPLADIFEQFEKAVTELKKCDTFLQEKQQQAYQRIVERLMQAENVAIYDDKVK